MRITRRLSIVRKLLKDNRKIKTGTPFWLKFLYLTRGFTSEKIKLYKLNNTNYKLYLSAFKEDWPVQSTVNTLQH